MILLSKLFLSAMMLSIFAAPIGYLIGFLLIGLLISWGLWWLLFTTWLPPAHARRNIGYIVYGVIMFVYWLWYIDMAFGLGIF